MPIAPEAEPLPSLSPEDQPAHWLYSEQLGLALGYVGRYLRCFNPVTGAPLLRAAEALEALEAETLARAEADRRTETEFRRAETEAQARAEAEAEVARLRAELEALRNRPPDTGC